VLDVYDTCPETASGDLVDPSDGCSINQKCPCDDNYQNCVANASGHFVTIGLLTEAEKDIIVQTAAESGCGM
jgi:hypothetical protein